MLVKSESDGNLNVRAIKKIKKIRVLIDDVQRAVQKGTCISVFIPKGVNEKKKGTLDV